ncbi:hypothetical protein ASG22_06970 [Chryseobacterium sp. Leaf405]|nr:hypothetical protein ASG22_06970 [Chryseobacterium sp. Leaf405]
MNLIINIRIYKEIWLCNIKFIKIFNTRRKMFVNRNLSGKLVINFYILRGINELLFAISKIFHNFAVRKVGLLYVSAVTC